MFRRFEGANAMGGLHIRSILDDGNSLKLLSEARKQGILYPYAQREGLVNFFDPKAVDWWWDHAVTRITDLGCRLLKTDVGSALNVQEDAPAKLRYKARADHNLFPIAYAAAPFHKFMQLTGKRGFNHTREGYAGIQRYPFIWAGDWGSEWQWFEPIITGGSISVFPVWATGRTAWKVLNGTLRAIRNSICAGYSLVCSVRSLS